MEKLTQTLYRHPQLPIKGMWISSEQFPTPPLEDLFNLTIHFIIPQKNFKWSICSTIKPIGIYEVPPETRGLIPKSSKTIYGTSDIDEFLYLYEWMLAVSHKVRKFWVCKQCFLELAR